MRTSTSSPPATSSSPASASSIWPEDYKDAIEVLREEAVLDADLAERLKGWMGFRNVLVHLYLETDHQRSYEAIHHELDDLDAFAAGMAKFLEE